MAISMSQLASRYAAASRNVDGATRKKMAQFAELGVGYVKRSIQDYHAVDTGTMLNSTTRESAGKNTYLIGPTVQYAPFIALGTSRMAARPFHIKAANQLRSKMRSMGFKAGDLGI